MPDQNIHETDDQGKPPPREKRFADLIPGAPGEGYVERSTRYVRADIHEETLRKMGIIVLGLRECLFVMPAMGGYAAVEAARAAIAECEEA